MHHSIFTLKFFKHEEHEVFTKGTKFFSLWINKILQLYQPSNLTTTYLKVFAKASSMLG